ncbi:hypothetical protein MNV49_000276 [Pseudohyphozyma bogoriensis]|nr:hypothetical protein MNV49_000276 [Pseudohyphozyma bogoriensis]
MSHSRQRSSISQPWHPPASASTYKDLLIFEERLKQNSERHNGEDMKYSLVHYGNVASLLVSLVTLILFFATGMYSEKIAYAYKFVPQANRALRPFNIYLNTRKPPWFNFSFLRSAPTPPTPPPHTITSPPLSRRTSASSTASNSSIGARSLRRSSPPPSSPQLDAPTPILRPASPPLDQNSPVTRSISPSPPPPVARGVPLAPIPPATSPRGEIIFSSRVSAAFREGYERYRGEYERRRMNLNGGGSRWWKFGWGKKVGISNEKDREKREGSAESEKGEKRGERTRTTSFPYPVGSSGGGSKSSSRNPSPHRGPSPPFRTYRPASAASSRSSSRSPPSTRPASPSAYDEDSEEVAPLPFVAKSKKEGESGSEGRSRSGSGSSAGGGRLRAESFSALLGTMDEVGGG